MLIEVALLLSFSVFFFPLLFRSFFFSVLLFLSCLFEFDLGYFILFFEFWIYY